MQIVVTNLTRMKHGNVCVAGVHVKDGENVRPVLRSGQLRLGDLSPAGGPFDLATVVDLGPVQPVPTLPQAEDHEYRARAARAVGPVEPTLFWDMLRFLARPSLLTLFGDELRPVGRSAAVVPEGRGVASLGTLRPAAPPRLYVTTRPDGRRSIRIRVRDDELDLSVSVTDLRLHGADGESPDEERVQAVNRRMEEGEDVLLSVGLTRAFASASDREPVHWLQVNNVHLERTPCWRLADNVRAGYTRSLPARHRALSPHRRDARRKTTHCRRPARRAGDDRSERRAILNGGTNDRRAPLRRGGKGRRSITVLTRGMNNRRVRRCHEIAKSLGDFDVLEDTLDHQASQCHDSNESFGEHSGPTRS